MWGSNQHGQLGDGTNIDRHTAVEIIALASKQPTSISLGKQQSACRTHFDGATIKPHLTTPMENQYMIAGDNSFTLTFSLPEAASPGTVQLQLTKAGSEPIVIVFAGGFETKGTHQMTVPQLSRADLSPNIVSVSTVELVDGARYTATLSYQDAAGNAANTDTRTSILVDLTAPILNSVMISSDNNVDSLAKEGNTITIMITSSEEIQPPTVTISKEPTVVTGSGTSWLATYIVPGVASSQAVSDGLVQFEVDFKDIAGNMGIAVSGTTDGSEVSITRVTQALTFAHPKPNSYIISSGDSGGTSFMVSFTLPEAASPGTVQLSLVQE